MLHHHYKIDKRSARGKQQQVMEKGRENQQPTRHEGKKGKDFDGESFVR